MTTDSWGLTLEANDVVEATREPTTRDDKWDRLLTAHADLLDLAREIRDTHRRPFDGLRMPYDWELAGILKYARRSLSTAVEVRAQESKCDLEKKWKKKKGRVAT